MDIEKEIFTIKECADILHISKWKLYEYIRAKAIEPISYNGKLSLHKQDIIRIARQGLTSEELELLRAYRQGNKKDGKQ